DEGQPIPRLRRACVDLDCTRERLPRLLQPSRLAQDRPHPHPPGSRFRIRFNAPPEPLQRFAQLPRAQRQQPEVPEWLQESGGVVDGGPEGGAGPDEVASLHPCPTQVVQRERVAYRTPERRLVTTLRLIVIPEPVHGHAQLVPELRAVRVVAEQGP